MATVAFQLAGKATRDALYLSTFSVDTLPRMFIAAAIVSATLTILLTRVMVRIGPGRLVPPLFAASAALLLGEWWLTGLHRPTAAILVYLHFAGLGALLVSGFWAIVNERFDPRTARGTIGRITTGASLGGVLGGLLPERVGAMYSVVDMLPVLAALHAASAVCVWLLYASSPPVGPPVTAPTTAASPRRAFARSGYLQLLALLVLLTASAEGLLDYLFKAGAASMMTNGAELLRFFAAFHLGAAILTIGVQLLLLRPLLDRTGIGRTAALLPGGVAAGSLAALVLPGVGVLFALRGLEIVLRGSVFRASYEMLFTPVSPDEKRATKLLIDVGAARMGDIVGAVVVQGVLWIGVLTMAPLLVATMLCAALALLVAQRLDAGYTRALGRSLRQQASRLGPEPVASAMLETFGALDLSTLRTTTAYPPPTAAQQALLQSPGRPSLSASDPAAVRAALGGEVLRPDQIDQVVSLLAWDELAPDAIRSLRRVPPEETPRLLQHLLDPREDFAVRRRLIPVLAERPSQEVFDGMMGALNDARFEVRYRAGLGLSRIAAQRTGIQVDRATILNTLRREVEVERGVWESRQLIDATDEWSPLEAEVLRDRATRSLEHVFTLLSLIFPRETVMIAYHGLHASDPYLRGTALEYLEAVLPEHLRLRLWPFLEAEERIGTTRKSADQAVEKLLASRESILLALEAVREKDSRSP